MFGYLIDGDTRTTMICIRNYLFDERKSKGFINEQSSNEQKVMYSANMIREL